MAILVMYSLYVFIRDCIIIACRFSVYFDSTVNVVDYMVMIYRVEFIDPSLYLTPSDTYFIHIRFIEIQ